MFEQVKIDGGKETFEVEGNPDTVRARAPEVGIESQLLIGLNRHKQHLRVSVEI